MLTVEEIWDLIWNNTYEEEGSICGVGDAAQAIYEAQKAGDDPWIKIRNTEWQDTSYIQMRNGRLYRERIIRKDEGPSVALCFVPGEGCGEREWHV